MGNNFYNNEESEFKETIDSLKSLPKIKADDNFEYNLMVKINNENFELKTEKAKKSVLWKVLPAPAVVAAAILAFFLMPEETVDTGNSLLQFSPIQVIDSAKQAQLSAQSSALAIKDKAVDETVQNKEVKSEALSNEEKVFRMNVQENDVAVKEKMNIPFDPRKEVDIDNYIDGKEANTTAGSPANLVSGGDKVTRFEGFIIKNQNEKDSLSKMDSKKDSLAEKTNK